MIDNLVFWKYKKDIYLNNQDVYTKLSEGKIIEGLEDLPIDEIMNIISKEFSEWKEISADYKNPKGNDFFRISFTKQFIKFDCSDMNIDKMNIIIDLMLKYDCPLYDPQLPIRYDGK